MKTKQISKKDLKASARKFSIKEGLWWSGRVSFGDYYISPFAIAINTSNSLVALLTSIAGILGAISQIFGSRLIERWSRKKILVKSTLLESLIWIPMILIALLFYMNILTGILPLILLTTYALFVILSSLGSPAWFSWMGDVVDKQYRGRYFSKRNLLTGFVSIILAIIASMFLDYFQTKNWTMFGFIILFLLAFMSRIISRNTFKKQYEPKIKLKKSYYFTFWDFILEAPKTNFGRFTIYRSLIGFASAIASPLVAVLLLRYYHFNYLEYMVIVLGGTLISLFILEILGKLADDYGNYKILFYSSLAIPLIPLAWILFPAKVFFLLIPSIISGAAWAGIDLSARNIIYDNVHKQKRAIAASYFNMCWGVSIAIGAAIGAFLIKYLNTKTIAPIIIIFIISAIIRAIIIVWWLPKIREVRKTKKFIPSFKSIKHLFSKEVKPTIFKEIHEITSIGNYLLAK